MLGVGLICVILFAHWVADFVFQSTWMATNKSTSLKALSAHIVQYMGCTGVVIGSFMLTLHLTAGVAVPALAVVTWVALNGAAHFLVDFVTSRITKRAYEQKKMNIFWMTIGFDQFLHVATMMVTWLLIF